MIPAIDDTRERLWTPELDARLLQLRKAGLTLPVIGERIGRSASACSSRVNRLIENAKMQDATDYLGNKVEAFMANIATTRGFTVSEVKRAFGWRGGVGV